MIRYALTCQDGHAFESWFQSAGAFDDLLQAGHLSCPVCNGKDVAKALMAPTVAPGRNSQIAPVQTGAPMVPVAQAGSGGSGPLGPRTAREVALRALRQKIEAKSDYVGSNFAAEARKIHLGDAPERAIYGEARGDEARALIEDGIPVLPLPIFAARKVN